MPSRWHDASDQLWRYVSRFGFSAVTLAFTIAFAWHVQRLGLGETTGLPAVLIVITLVLGIVVTWRAVRSRRVDGSRRRTRKRPFDVVDVSGSQSDETPGAAASTGESPAAAPTVDRAKGESTWTLGGFGVFTIVALAGFLVILPTFGFVISALIFGVPTTYVFGRGEKRFEPRTLMAVSAVAISVIALWALFKYLFLLPLPSGTVHIG